MIKDRTLMVFAHLAGAWAPCGQLTLTEQGSSLLASSFAYGLRYLDRQDALEVDPVSLGIHDVLPRPTLATERFLHLNVGPQGRSATIDNAMAGCAAFSLSGGRAAELVAQVWAVVREGKVFFERSGVQGAELAKVAPAFRHLDDISNATTRRVMP